MPWYKAGTVSVVLNSNAVIGTGTAFLANGRVGDAFRGPDGGWYEVINIASDTAMSISPVYKGATNAAGAYALAPMQGYVKDSADALRGLVNTYGAKLAALGTTGNYDILPVAKGGTGGATQADARIGLGLGSAAVVEIQTSVTDATVGRAMLNGAWGWGSVSADNPTDLNAIAVSQKFGVNTGALNTPWALGSTTVPFAAGSSGLAMTWTASHQSQIIVNRTAAMVALRRKNAGVWAADDYFCLYPTGKTFLDVTQGGTGNATGTAPKLAAAAIVGAVAQSGGLPTGAIIEKGSNANGQYTRFADGTQICRQKYQGQRTLGTPAGALFYAGGKEASLIYPIPFASEPSVSITATGFTYECWWAAGGWPSPLQAWPGGYILTQVQRTQSDLVFLDLIAIGRWF